MQRYFASTVDGIICLSDEDRFHMQKVMRMHPGDLFEIVTESDVKQARLISLSPLTWEDLSSRPLRSETCEITLFYCLPKGEKFDLVLQKATELGVTAIQGLISSRTIVRLNEQERIKKGERYQRIIKEASEQCGRDHLPKWLGISDYSTIDGRDFDLALIADEERSGTTSTLFHSLSSLTKPCKIAVLVGCEGGFSREEVSLANERGFRSIGLGPRILRSETAAISALAMISLMMERDGNEG